MANELSTMKNIAQARAKEAWDKANSQGNKDNKEYGSVVNKVPTYIKTNGLLNTLAFLYSKKNSGKNGELLKNIREWLTHSEFGLVKINPNNDEELLKHLTTAEAKKLIQYTTEVLALFNWLRRFAKS